MHNNIILNCVFSIVFNLYNRNNFNKPASCTKCQKIFC